MGVAGDRDEERIPRDGACRAERNNSFDRRGKKWVSF
jgi:hypothetical protein